MPGIDLLISRYLANEIKSNLKTNILKKLERDLFFIHGMSIKLSIENFDTFHNLLKNFPDIESRAFEKICLDKVVKIKKSNNDYTLKIINTKLLNKIFDYFGDKESRKLLLSIMGSNLTIPEILTKTKILKSPAYRKIENMLLDGMILESGKILSKTKRVSQYRCLFNEITFSIGNNKFEANILIKKNDLESSSIFRFGVIES